VDPELPASAQTTGSPQAHYVVPEDGCREHPRRVTVGWRRVVATMFDRERLVTANLI
jgi:hypothetical protein